MSLSGGGARRRKRARRAQIPIESESEEKWNVRDFRHRQARARSKGRPDKAVLVTAQQYRKARRWGAAGVVCMDPDDFLRLTTKTQDEVQRIQNEAQPLDVYNDLARAGEITTPYLDVEVGTKGRGKILGHEGRHRAVALARAGGKCLPVAVFPVKDGWKVKQPDRSSNPESLIPKRFCAQYSDDPDLCAVPRRTKVSKLPRP